METKKAELLFIAQSFVHVIITRGIYIIIYFENFIFQLMKKVDSINLFY